MGQPSTPRLPPIKNSSNPKAAASMPPRPPAAKKGAQTERGAPRTTAKGGLSRSVSARGPGDVPFPGSRQGSLKPPEEGALPMAPMSPRQRKLIGSMTDAQLKADIGGCPTPWWWAEKKDADGNSTRAPTPLEAFAAGAGSRSMYVHWLYAQCLGYQGFSIPLGSFGQMVLTTPAPVRESHVKMITARGLDAKLQDEILDGVMAESWVEGCAGWKVIYDEAAAVVETAKEPVVAAEAALAEPGSGPKQEKDTEDAKASLAAAEEALGKIAVPVELAAGAMTHGPGIDLLPHGCAFKDTNSEFQVDIRGMVGSYEGDALFCVLRKDSDDGPWTPLNSDEKLTLSPDGLATVEIAEFAQVMFVWWKGLECLEGVSHLSPLSQFATPMDLCHISIFVCGHV